MRKEPLVQSFESLQGFTINERKEPTKEPQEMKLNNNSKRRRRRRRDELLGSRSGTTVCGAEAKRRRTKEREKPRLPRWWVWLVNDPLGTNNHHGPHHGTIRAGSENENHFSLLPSSLLVFESLSL